VTCQPAEAARAALLRAYVLMEAAQDGDVPGARAELAALEARAEQQAWPEVAFLAAAGQAVCGILTGAPGDGVLDALVDRSQMLQAPAMTALALALRAVSAARAQDTATLLADAGRAVAIAEDADLPALDRCTVLVVAAAAYNTLSLWELAAALYDEAAALESLCEEPLQRPAVAVNRVLIRLEWATALLELGATEDAMTQLAHASHAASLATGVDRLPRLWRLDVLACVDVLDFFRAAVEHSLPVAAVQSRLAAVADHRAALVAAGDVEVLPLLDALVALALLGLGRDEEARAAARRLSDPASASSGAGSFPAWVRAQVLTATVPDEGVEAHQAYGRLVAQARWTARRGVLAAARSKIAGERLRVEHATLTRDVMLDSLTGLSNRRRFDGWLEQQPLTPRTTALLLIDLDSFKAINDSHGHAVGDEVLRLVGRQVLTHVRPGDLALRLGGDEFAVILEDDHEPEPAGLGSLLDDFARIATARAEALREAVAGTDWGRVTAGLQVDLSIGVAVAVLSPDRPGAADRLYRQADADLYAAKSGRQPVTVATTRARVGGSAHADEVRWSLTPDHTRNGSASSTDQCHGADENTSNSSPVHVVLSASRDE
jgi:diguanylate cyclase (GGDEF)-like protein